MMKANTVLLAAALASASPMIAQTYDWRPDTLHTGVGYAQDAFFHLDEGQIKTVDNNNWDIAIPGSGNGFRYIPATNNYGNGLNGKLIDVELPVTAFGTDLTADTAGKPLLTNDPAFWDKGAFGEWGEYDISDHSIRGNKLYVYACSHGAYQIVVERYKATSDPAGRQWTLKVANIDGTDTGTYYIEPHAEGYSDEHFFYFNLAERTFLSREPKIGAWHLLATKYGDAYGSMPGVYGITGILTAPTVEVAQVISLEPEALDYEEVSSYDDSTRNVIGGKFKDMDGAYQWFVVDSLNYFIKAGADDAQAGDIWQIYFDYFPTATAGVDVKIGLQVRKVYDATSGVGDAQPSPARVVVAPNPAQSQVNLVVDAQQALGDTRIYIFDLGGRCVAQYARHLHSGFQQLVMDISHLTSGIYMIQVDAKEFNHTEKLIVK